MKVNKKSNVALQLGGVFLAGGVFLLVFSILVEMQVMAFIGLGLMFWGAILALTRDGKYVESSLLDASAQSMYLSIDRMLNEQKKTSQAYYLPAYPQDVSLPEYVKSLTDPTVYITESFNGNVSLDELTAGRFFSVKNGGFFLASPGSGIVEVVERYLKLDLTKVSPTELCEVFPKCLTESLNLAKNAQMNLTPDGGATFKATGILYDSLYSDKKPRSASLLGCPVVCAAASAFAKSSGKMVVLGKMETFSNNTVSVQFRFA